MAEKLKKLWLLISLLTLLIIAATLGDYIPMGTKSFLYAISLSMKQILLFAIPFIIFSYLFYSLLRLDGGVLTFVFTLVIMVYASNFTAINMAHQIDKIFLNKFHVDFSGKGAEQTILEPAWSFTLPKMVANETALIFGFLAGVFFSVMRNNKAVKLAEALNNISNIFLKKFFIPVLPIFIFGFMLKLEHEKILTSVIKLYGPIFGIVVSMQILYVSFLYFAASGFSPSKFITYLRNVFPAGLTGFSAMSSMAALPLSIIGAEQNLKDEKMAKLLMPATVNIHTLGSAIGMATLITFNMPVEYLDKFLMFSVLYAFAKFAVAAVPGGAVIVVTPLIEKYLGFTPEMSGLITVAYIFFDPFGTSCNVFANGAFAIIFSKVYKKVTTLKERMLGAVKSCTL